MGGETFNTIEYGKTAAEAFQKAVDRAHYDYGHRGYTGTIAEKDGFTVIRAPNDDPEPFLDLVREFGRGRTDTGKTPKALVEQAHKIYDDKWGPALCIPTTEKNEKGETKFIFCGWASC